MRLITDWKTSESELKIETTRGTVTYVIMSWRKGYVTAEWRCRLVPCGSPESSSSWSVVCWQGSTRSTFIFSRRTMSCAASLPGYSRQHLEVKCLSHLSYQTLLSAGAWFFFLAISSSRSRLVFTKHIYPTQGRWNYYLQISVHSLFIADRLKSFYQPVIYFHPAYLLH